MTVAISRDGFYVDRDRRLCEAYQHGAGVVELRWRFMLSDTSVVRILKKHGVVAMREPVRW